MAYYCSLVTPHYDMRSLGTFVFVAIVFALLAQSLSLALNTDIKPHVYNKLGSKIEHKNAKSYDPFSVARAPASRRTVFMSFWLHGFKSAMDPFREKPPKTSHPMSRSAWVSSPYYRAGLDFHEWGKKRASWEAHRYDRYITLEFLSKAHMTYALIGYWSGRLFFFCIALALLLILTAAATIHRAIIQKTPGSSGARVHL